MSDKKDFIRIKDFDVQIIRTSRKKTASLVIEHGQLQLIVPESYQDDDVARVISKKQDWILKKTAEQKHYPPAKAKEFVNGENIIYLGKNYRLKLCDARQPSVDLQDGYICINLSKNIKHKADRAREVLIDWYIAQAQEKLEEKALRFSKIIGVIPQSVNVKDYKNRWGSCNKDGNLSFNWRIVIAPHRIIDYIVMHELCHIQHHNHSKEFWYTLGCHMPDFLERKEWLRANGHLLSI